MSEELIQKVRSETVSEEEVYASVTTTSTAYGKAVGSTIPEGYEGIIIGVAVSADETITMFLKREDKHVYPDGLNTAGMSKVPQSAGTAGLVGVDNEVQLLVLVKEKKTWELGFKASAGTPKVNWRIRIRLYKKA